MSGKEKLYFLLERIADARAIAPSGKPVLIDPANDLNKNYREVELMQLLTKLEVDEKVIKIVATPKTDSDSILLDPYAGLEEGCYKLEILPAFDNYFLKIQQEPEYQKFTGKKFVPSTETQQSHNLSEIQSLYNKISEAVAETNGPKVGKIDDLENGKFELTKKPDSTIQSGDLSGVQPIWLPQWDSTRTEKYLREVWFPSNYQFQFV